MVFFGRSSSGSLFLAATETPAGFETLAAPWKTMVDVYYGNQLLLSTGATISPETITFSNPEEVASRIPNVKDRVSVTAALTGRLANHAFQICSRGRSTNDECGVIKPDIAGVIFDEHSFRATVFVAPLLLETEGARQSQYLPPSSSQQIGFVQTLNASASGSSRGKNREVLYGYSSLGRGEISIESEWDIASGEGGRIASLFAERDYYGTDLRAGYMQTSGFGFSFTPDRPVIGVHAGLSENTRTDLSAGRTTPLDVFLPIRGRVDVYRDGILLRSWLLDAGSHQLNTRGFPSGSYTLQVRVLGEANQVISDDSRFFVSQPGLPPLGTTLWFADAGRLVDWEKRKVWPETENNWLARLGGSRRLGDSYGGTLAAAATRHASIFEGGLHYAGESFDISPSLLGSDHRDYGVKIDSRIDMGRALVTLGYRKLHPKKDEPPDPVLFGRNSESLYASCSARFLDGLVQYRYSRYSTLTVKGENQHTLSYQRMLIQDQRYEVEGRVETAAMGRDRRVLAALYFRLRRDRVLHTISPRYERFRYNDEGWDDTAALRYNISYSDTFPEGQQLQTSGWAEARSGQKSAGASLRYFSRLGEVSSGVDYYREQDRNTTSWAMGAATSFSWASGQLAVGGQYGRRSMLVVQMEGVQPDAVFQVMVDGQARGYTKGRMATVIPLEPFSTYRVGVHASDAGLYEYREDVREVTLYPGNVSLQSFNAQPVRLFYGQLRDQSGQPLAGATIVAGKARTTTDSQGLYQLEADGGVSELSVQDVRGKEQAISVQTALYSQPELMGVVNLGIRETSLDNLAEEILIQPDQLISQPQPVPSLLKPRDKPLPCRIARQDVLICLLRSPFAESTSLQLRCLASLCGDRP